MSNAPSPCSTARLEGNNHATVVWKPSLACLLKCTQLKEVFHNVENIPWLCAHKKHALDCVETLDCLLNCTKQKQTLPCCGKPPLRAQQHALKERARHGVETLHCLGSAICIPGVKMQHFTLHTLCWLYIVYLAFFFGRLVVEIRDYGVVGVESGCFVDHVDPAGRKLYAQG